MDRNKTADTQRSELMYALLNEAITGLLQKLKQISCEACGARAASAQDFSNVIKFLKDNGFTISPDKGTDELSKLIEHMEAHGEYPSTSIPS